MSSRTDLSNDFETTGRELMHARGANTGFVAATGSPASSAPAPATGSAVPSPPGPGSFPGPGPQAVHWQAPAFLDDDNGSAISMVLSRAERIPLQRAQCYYNTLQCTRLPGVILHWHACSSASGVDDSHL
jgi:hypothetical protein